MSLKTLLSCFFTSEVSSQSLGHKIQLPPGKQRLQRSKPYLVNVLSCSSNLLTVSPFHFKCCSQVALIKLESTVTSQGAALEVSPASTISTSIPKVLATALSIFPRAFQLPAGHFHVQVLQCHSSFSMGQEQTFTLVFRVLSF